MTPKGARLFGILFALLFAGVVWFQVAKHRVDAGFKADADREAVELTDLRKQNRDLQDAIRVARSKSAAQDQALLPEEPAANPAANANAASNGAAAVASLSPSDRAARTQALLALIKSGTLGELTYAAPSAYKISTKVAKLSEVLGLAPDETDTLQRAAAAVGDTLLSGARVLPGDNVIAIEMTDSPEARAQLAKMRETFSQVLGPDGSAIYEAMGFRVALENSLNNLGLTPYTMNVTRSFDPATGAETYAYVRQGTGVIIQANAANAARNNAAVAPVTDEEAARMTASRQQQQARLDDARAARGAAAGPAPANRAVNRDSLATALGPLNSLIPHRILNMKTAAVRPPADIPMASWEKGVAAVLVIAGAIGFWMAWGTLSDQRSSGIKLAGSRTEDIERARTEQARLERVAAETNAVVVPSPAAGAARSNASTPAPKAQAVALVTDLISKGILRSNPVVPGANAARGQATTPAYYVGADGKLSPGFGELFHLDPAQVSKLQGVVTAMKQQAEEAVVAHTTVRPEGDNTYVLEMQPFGDEAKQMRESVVTEFRNTLGDEQFKEFAVLNGLRIQDDGTVSGGSGGLAGVSGEGRTITIVRNATNFQYTLQTPAGNQGGRGTMRDLTPVITRFAPIDKLLPPSFTAPFPEATPTGRGGPMNPQIDAIKIQGDQTASPRAARGEGF